MVVFVLISLHPLPLVKSGSIKVFSNPHRLYNVRFCGQSSVARMTEDCWYLHGLTVEDSTINICTINFLYYHESVLAFKKNIFTDVWIFFYESFTFPPPHTHREKYNRSALNDLYTHIFQKNMIIILSLYN